ncbi:MAG: hypothetical protein NT062_35345 [Proteobacteria bacterium]|nr:hypothetical protein [Pseudomonadota bacterium]
MEPWQYGLLGGVVLLSGVGLWLRHARLSAAAAAKPDAKPAKADAKSAKADAKPAKADAKPAKDAKDAKDAPDVKADAEPTKATPTPTPSDGTAKPRLNRPITERPIPRSVRPLVVFAGDTNARLLATSLPVSHVRVKNQQDFVAATKGKSGVAFVDVDLLPQLGDDRPIIPVIGMIDDSPSETIAQMIKTLDSYPWLTQVVTTTMLASSQARTSLETLLEVIDRPDQVMLGVEGMGRIALLAESNHREARFERIEAFFAKHKLAARTITAINDVAEELVMNALYDAPTEAGYFKAAVSREENVTLPADRACEISYGIEGGNVFVRVRDTFGSLSRTRLLDVLRRCSTKAVELDESRGGAGLGLWRIFSVASSITITVIPGHLTDVVVRMSTTNGRINKKLQAIHLFFSPTTEDPSPTPPNDDRDLMDQSVTLIRVDE